MSLPDLAVAAIPGGLVIDDHRNSAARGGLLDRVRLLHVDRQRLLHHHGNVPRGARLHHPGVIERAGERRDGFGLHRVEHLREIGELTVRRDVISLPVTRHERRVGVEYRDTRASCRLRAALFRKPGNVAVRQSGYRKTERRILRRRGEFRANRQSLQLRNDSSCHRIRISERGVVEWSPCFFPDESSRGWRPLSRPPLRIAAADSKIDGVQIGVISYSLRQIPNLDVDTIIKVMSQLGLTEVELMSNHAERAAGAPAQRQELRAWRTSGVDGPLHARPAKSSPTPESISQSCAST